MRKIIITILFVGLVTGCQQQTKELSNLRVVPVEDNNIAVEVTTTRNKTQNKEIKMTVREEVKGNDVYVECIVSEFTFSKKENKSTGKGYLNLYLNGKKIDEIFTPAFIIKGLPAGKHKITLELVHNDGSSFGIKEDLEVVI